MSTRDPTSNCVAVTHVPVACSLNNVETLVRAIPHEVKVERWKTVDGAEDQPNYRWVLQLSSYDGKTTFTRMSYVNILRYFLNFILKPL